VSARLRHEQIGEALGDVKTLLLDPDGFGDTNVTAAAVSLASEFVGEFADQEIVRRLDALSLAAQSGDLKAACRHLRNVERKVRERFGITPVASVPLIPDATAKRLATTRVSGVAKVQVVRSHVSPVSPQASRPDGSTEPRIERRWRG